MEPLNRCNLIRTPPVKIPNLIQQRMGQVRNVCAARNQSRIPALIQPKKITRSQSVRDKPSSTFSITELVEAMSCNNTNTTVRESTKQVVKDDVSTCSTTNTTLTTKVAKNYTNSHAGSETSSKISSSNPPLANQKVLRAATFKVTTNNDDAVATTASFAKKVVDNGKTLQHTTSSTLKTTFASLRAKYQGISPVEDSESKKTSYNYDNAIAKMEKEILQTIETFPSALVQQTRGASYTASWSWLRSYKNIKDKIAAESDNWNKLCIMDGYFKQVQLTVVLLNRIRHDFAHGPREYETQASKDIVDRVCKEMLLCKVGIRGLSFVSEGVVPYMRDTFKHEVHKQTKYQKWMCKNFTDPVEAKKRNILVQWVVETVIKLKYPAETSHLAVHYIDAYLRIKGNKISECAWPLLGITALFIAGKMEEVDPPDISTLVRMSGKHYKVDEVKWMERQILEKLEFDIYPPLPSIFVSLIILGGTLEFPTLSLRKLALDLSMGILHRSLLNHKLFSIPPLDKAKAALEIAVEFIFYQYHVCKRRDMSAFSFLNSEPGLAIGQFTLDICSETFTSRFTNRILSNRVPAMACKASPVRDIKA